MRSLYFAFSVLIFIAGKCHLSDSRETRNNLCPKVVSYAEEHVVPETVKVKEEYKTFCWSLFRRRCTKHRWNTVTVNKTIIDYKTKHVFDCCPGYKKENGVCIPTCKLGCNHGECIEPDVCMCEPGWREPLCQIECERNRFGRGCKDNCTCFHGADCDPETGYCHCMEGYTGDQCQLLCPENTYGKDCNYECKCKNNAICDIVDGTCYCKAGYEGVYCEKICDNGTHGQDCGKDCICIPENTESCHHVDGKCTCKPGYRGESCEKECDDFTYGPNCSKKCSCLHSDFCDHINGKCYCKPGWTSETCSKICPIGTYGENCSFDCSQCVNISGHCDHVSGECHCPDGRFGDLCEIECFQGYWGPNCSNICSCTDSQFCDAIDGTCSWSDACIPGYWGPNCSNTCSCTESQSCDPVDGKCSFSEEPYSYGDSKYDPGFMVVISSVAVIVILMICIIGCSWGHHKGYDTSFPVYSLYDILDIIGKNRHKKNKSKLSGAVLNNPVYDFNEVVLESEQNRSGFIRGSASTGVKYVKNNVNDLDAEKKLSNVEKTDDVAVERKLNRSDLKDLSIRKTNVLSDVFKGIKRSSMPKSDSTHSSTNELEKDFQPEVLDDFNVIENIYEKPTENVNENIYDKPVFLDNKNLSLKE